MKYNTETHAAEADARLQELIERKAIVEILDKKKSKTVSQNAYLHAIISLASIHFGLSEKGYKDILKSSARLIGLKWVIEDEAFGHIAYRSTSTYNSLEISQFTEHTRDFSQTNDCYLPTPMEYKQEQIGYDNEIEKQKQYL